MVSSTPSESQTHSLKTSSNFKFGRLPQVLDPLERERLEREVDSLDKLWLNRSTCKPIVPFWTLGAVTYLEGCDDIGKYHKHRTALNPILKKKFSWMYKILCARLTEELGDLCVVDDMLGLPGFHIFGQKKNVRMTERECRLLEQPLASIHTDIQYKEHRCYWKCFEEVDFTNPLSFTMAVTLPRNGGGLFIWDWANFDQEMIDNFNFQPNEDKVEVLNNKYLWDNGSTNGYEPTYEPILEKYIEGNLVYFTGHVVHQIAPAKNCHPYDRRITVQGHGLKCDGVWRLYF